MPQPMHLTAGKKKEKENKYILMDRL